MLLFGLSFSPTCHFSLFNTMIDVNRFVRLLTIRKRFLTCSDEVNDDFPQATMEQTDTIETLCSQTSHVCSNTFSDIDKCDIICTSFVEQMSLSHMQEQNRESLSPNGIITQNKKNFTKNPAFYPVQARSSVLNRFQELVEQEICDLKLCYSQAQSQFTDDCGFNAKDNLTSKQRQALNTLTKIDNIVIRPADKGGLTVIRDKGLYMNENSRMLSKVHSYFN